MKCIWCQKKLEHSIDLEMCPDCFIHLTRENYHCENCAALRAKVAALEAENAQHKAVIGKLWTCQTCGAMFPKTPTDEHVKQCSKCVEVEALASEVKYWRAEYGKARNGRQALVQAAVHLRALCGDAAKCTPCSIKAGIVAVGGEDVCLHCRLESAMRGEGE